MLDKVCQVLKGIAVIGWLCASQVEAATYYASVGGCAASCACTEVAPCSLPRAISQAAAPGDVVEMRAGIYYPSEINSGTDSIRIRNKTNLTIQGYHYGLVDAERPIMDGSASRTWTRCTTCNQTDNIACIGIPAGAPCSQFWYYVGASPSLRAVVAVHSNGRPTYRVESLSDLTNSHTGYISGSCSTKTWIACSVNSDCPTGETCTGPTMPEIDSYSTEGAPSGNLSGTITARWRDVVNNTDITPGRVINDNNGDGFDIGAVTGLVIKGIDFRNFSVGAVRTTTLSGGTPPVDSTITDCSIAYVERHAHSAYGIVLNGSTNLTLSNNYFAYTQDEAIHNQARASEAATKMTITGNFIVGTGMSKVLGPCVKITTDTNLPCTEATPEGMTLGGNSSDGSGNYQGSVLSGNMLRKIGKQGIIFESNYHGVGGDPVTVSNNIIYSTQRSGLRMPCGSTASHTIAYINFFNNIILDAAQLAGNYAIDMTQDTHPLCAITDLNFYNNTIIARPGAGMNENTSWGTNFDNIVVRNNIFYQVGELDPGKYLVSLPDTSAGNVLSNNIIFNTYRSPNLVSFKGSTYDCNGSGLPALGNQCTEPGFYDPSNFLFYPTGGTFGDPGQYLTNSMFGGPAIDMGTATGMPAAKTTGIVNTLASAHGFGFYSDSVAQGGSAWDAGAVESILSYGGNITGWSTFTPVFCSAPFGGTPTSPGGNDFLVKETRSPSIECTGMSQALTLTVGKNYLIGFRLTDAGDIGGGGCVGDEIGTMSFSGTTGATISLVNFPSNFSGVLDPTTGRLTARVNYGYRLTPTQTNVTLKFSIIPAAFGVCSVFENYLSSFIIVPE